MRVVRIEHSSVLRKDRPAGPYAGSGVFFEPEHEGDEDVEFEWDCYNSEQECIHVWSEQLCWNSGSRRPTPQHDGLGWVVPDTHLFGFQSDEQMRDWFTGELRQMDRFGFVAAVYEVEDVQHGRLQSMFNWDTAKRLEDFPILRAKDIQAALDGGR